MTAPRPWPPPSPATSDKYRVPPTPATAPATPEIPLPWGSIPAPPIPTSPGDILTLPGDIIEYIPEAIDAVPTPTEIFEAGVKHALETLTEAITAPFRNWVQDLQDTGLKLVFTGGALVLIVVGAKRAVSRD